MSESAVVFFWTIGVVIIAGVIGALINAYERMGHLKTRMDVLCSDMDQIEAYQKKQQMLFKLLGDNSE